MKIRVRRNWYTDSVGLVIFSDDFKCASTNIIMSKFDEGALIEDTMRLDATEAQSLMDELWECGVRPTEGRGSAGAMSAVQEHLKDLRRIVFKDYK